MLEFAFVSLTVSERQRLFVEMVEYAQTMRDSLAHGTFGGKPGWLVADGDLAAAFLTSSAGVKSRPVNGQKYLGGVGALQSDSVAAVKRQLVAALATAARDDRAVHTHFAEAFGSQSAAMAVEGLTEAFSSAMLTQLAGCQAGTIVGWELRGLVMDTWERLESANSSRDDALSPPADLLEGFIAGLIIEADSGFLSSLRGVGWSDLEIVRELRAMVLSGWGSTTAATLSALALRQHVPTTRRFFLNEVMRLYPPGFMVGRTVVEHDGTFPFAVGDIVVVSPWLIHRNSLHWDRPSEFDVSRWDSVAARGWYMPFGIGARRCPASSFAKAQMKAALEVIGASHDGGRHAVLSMVERRSPSLVPDPVTGGCPVHHGTS